MTLVASFVRAWERVTPEPERLHRFVDRYREMIEDELQRLAQRSAPQRPRWTGRADFEERREARIDRLNNAADRASGEARRRFEQVGKNLPDFGQPILVGHHSEKRHRRAIERSDQNMRKHIEMSNRASDLRARAEAAEDNTAISSDDPQAIEKLKARIAQLEDKVAAWKEINKAIRSKDARTKLAEMGYSEKAIETLLTKDVMGDIGIPAYRFNNTRNNILRLKKRLAGLEAAAETEIPEPYESGGGTVTWDADTNRIIVKHSPGELLKEDRERRSEIMKSYGFNWGESYRGFVRQANASAFYRGKQALDGLVKDWGDRTEVRAAVAAAEKAAAPARPPFGYILKLDSTRYIVVIGGRAEFPTGSLQRAKERIPAAVDSDDESTWPVWNAPANVWTTLGRLSETSETMPAWGRTDDEILAGRASYGEEIDRAILADPEHEADIIENWERQDRVAALARHPQEMIGPYWLGTGRPQGTQLITREPGQRERWRVTRFDEQMEPLGHFGPETFPQVIERASQDGDLREFRPLTLSERLPFARRR